jgi:hypothetical protein
MYSFPDNAQTEQGQNPTGQPMIPGSDKLNQKMTRRPTGQGHQRLEQAKVP